MPRALVGSPRSASTSVGRIAAIDLDRAPPVESSRREGELHEIAHAVRFTCGDDVVVRLLQLQHQSHGLDIVAGKAPIALRFEVSQMELVLELIIGSDRLLGTVYN
jgi:hypothetical protein